MRTAFQIDLDYKSKTFGGVLANSVKDGYDSRLFVERLMTDKIFIPLLTMRQGQEWCDDAFLYYHIVHNFEGFKKGQTDDPYFLWFIGYTYKYWMITRKMKPIQVYKILDYDKFRNAFPFYHTQDWDFIINDATNAYKLGLFMDS